MAKTGARYLGIPGAIDMTPPTAALVTQIVRNFDALICTSACSIRLLMLPNLASNSSAIVLVSSRELDVSNVASSPCSPLPRFLPVNSDKRSSAALSVAGRSAIATPATSEVTPTPTESTIMIESICSALLLSDVCQWPAVID